MHVVVDQALSVTAEPLKIPFEVRVFPYGKTPIKLHRTSAEAGFNIVAKHQGEYMPVPFVGGMCFEVT